MEIQDFEFKLININYQGFSVVASKLLGLSEGLLRTDFTQQDGSVGIGVNDCPFDFFQMV